MSKPPAPPAAGKTSTITEGRRAPRSPNEHDESSDSQTGGPSDIGRQAKEDVDAGKRQTDRGEATDAAYRRQKS